MRLLCTQLRPGACCLTLFRSSRSQRLNRVAISQISFVQYCPRGSQKCRDVSARGLEPGAICVDDWRARAQSKTMDTGFSGCCSRLITMAQVLVLVKPTAWSSHTPAVVSLAQSGKHKSASDAKRLRSSSQCRSLGSYWECPAESSSCN